MFCYVAGFYLIAEQFNLVLTTTLFWFVLGHGSEVIYKTYSIPVEWAQLPKEYNVSNVDPSHVRVSLSGPRRYFYLKRKRKMEIKVDAANWKKGKKQSGYLILL